LPDAAVDLSLTGLLSRGLTPLSFDYLYLGLTNASAFSPADMMPMVPCVKTAMRVQPLISIAVIGPVLTVPGAPLAFHVMAKPTGAVCNLECEYCFSCPRRCCIPGPGSDGRRVTGDLYPAAAGGAHPGAGGGGGLAGSEPTIMGLDFFRRAIELERQYARPGQRVLNMIQTNGTLLDDEWGEFLKQNGFLAGISIDGPREMHDAYGSTRAANRRSAG
jgi:hypothetical protein